MRKELQRIWLFCSRLKRQDSSMKSLRLIFQNRLYFSIAWVFASLNIVEGTWVLYIPYVKRHLSLDNGEIGVSLFFIALGTLTTILFAPTITSKLGLGKTTFWSITFLALTLLLPMLAPTYVLLCAAGYIMGLGIGITDISMNALVSEVEKRDNVYFMSVSHGFFSLGGVISGGIGFLLFDLFDWPIYHIILAVLLILITNGVLFRSYWNINNSGSEKKSVKLKWSILKPLLVLAIVAFIIMGNEGAIAHWSKLFLQDIRNVMDDTLSSLGFILFSISMTIGRFFGDGLSEKYGSKSVVLFGSMISAVGYGLILIPNFYLNVIGFGFTGLGFSVIVPELFRTAGNVKNVSSVEGIAIVSGSGFLAFLLGPAILGFLADTGTLLRSFSVLLGSIVVAILIVLFLIKNIMSKDS